MTQSVTLSPSATHSAGSSDRSWQLMNRSLSSLQPSSTIKAAARRTADVAGNDSGGESVEDGSVDDGDAEGGRSDIAAMFF